MQLLKLPTCSKWFSKMKKNYKELTYEDRKKIEFNFLNNKENSVKKISDELNIGESAVSRTINEFLEKSKKKIVTIH